MIRKAIIRLTAIFILAGILLPFCAFPQLTVVQGAAMGLTPKQLVENWLVGGGITVNNVTCNGSSSTVSTNQAGYFQAAGNAFLEMKLDGGILMTTGTAGLATGPNNSATAGAATSFGGDPDLDLLLGSPTYDACVIEFDFVPSCDTIKFRYVFGSEEFYEYCGDSTINDVFGFFLSGPGISGVYSNNSINIALMPGTSKKVSIYNICNDPSSNWDNTGGVYFQYDGLTHVFTSWHLVTPNSTYHIKLAIGDAHDRNYDSGVFLERNSFSSGTALSVTHTNTRPSMGGSIIEGCNDVTVSFLLEKPAASPLVLYLSGAGTAVEGLDYMPLPDSLVIPAGQDSVSVLVHPLTDGLTEATETVILSAAFYSCNGNQSLKDTLYILDHPGLAVSAGPDTSLCEGNPVTIHVSASGGISPLSYQWNNSLGTDTILTLFPPAGIHNYIVTVTDDCLLTHTDTATVVVNTTATLTNQPTEKTICSGDSTGILLTANVAGVTFTWTPSLLSGNITGFSGGTGDRIDQVLVCQDDNPGTVRYHITLSGNSCDTSAADFTVNVGPLPILQLTDTVYLTRNASVKLSAGPGFSAYLWSTGASDSVIYAGNGGIYWVQVTNGSGCTAADTIRVYELGLYIPNAFTPNGDGLNDRFRIDGLEQTEEASLQIYNRWGELVFTTGDVAFGWDGTFNNRLCEAGPYIWMLRMKSPGAAKTTTLTGPLTLLR